MPRPAFEPMPLHWQLLLPLLCLATGFALGDVQPPGLLAGALYALWVLNAARLPVTLWLAVSLAGGVALAAHALPGFAPLVLVESVHFSAEAPAMALRLSWDKLLVGATLLAWWLSQPPRPAVMPGRALAAALAWLTLVPVFALWLDLVDWQPKWPPHLGLWLTLNLGVAVLTEELLFRALLQRRLVDRLGPWPGLLLTAGLFGAAHIPFSPLFALVAAFAGLGYGLVFHYSQRLWPALLLHGAVNLCHLLLLTYPLKVATP